MRKKEKEVLIDPGKEVENSSQSDRRESRKQCMKCREIQAGGMVASVGCFSEAKMRTEKCPVGSFSTEDTFFPQGRARA